MSSLLLSLARDFGHKQIKHRTHVLFQKVLALPARQDFVDSSFAQHDGEVGLCLLTAKRQRFRPLWAAEWEFGDDLIQHRPIVKSDGDGVGSAADVEVCGVNRQLRAAGIENTSLRTVIVPRNFWVFMEHNLSPEIRYLLRLRIW